jgi:hypothetical protein
MALLDLRDVRVFGVRELRAPGLRHLTEQKNGTLRREAEVVDHPVNELFGGQTECVLQRPGAGNRPDVLLRLDSWPESRS